jgi:hypothetical protein
MVQARDRVEFVMGGNVSAGGKGEENLLSFPLCRNEDHLTYDGG